MQFDRDRFLALALGLAGCHRAPPFEDPRCAGEAWVREAPICVATVDGWVARGFVRSEFCAVTAPGGACARWEFVPAPALDDPWHPDCSGIAWIDEAEVCVAWRTGGLVRGFVPTDECARTREDGSCEALFFDRAP